MPKSKKVQRSSKHAFIWKITQFSMCTYVEEEALKSPHFTAESLDNTIWYIDFYPKGANNLNNLTSCYIYRARKGNEGEPVYCKFTLEIIGLDGRTFFSRQDEGMFVNNQRRGWQHFIPIEHLKNKKVYFPDDTLIFRCLLESNLSWNTPKTSWNFAETKFGADRISFNVTVERSDYVRTSDTNVYQECKRVVFDCPPSVCYNMFLFFSKRDIDVYVVKYEGDEHVKVVCKMSLMDKSGMKCKSIREEYLFSTEDHNYTLTTKLTEEQLLEDGNRYLKNNSVNLFVEFLISNGSETKGIEEFHDHPLLNSDASSSEVPKDGYSKTETLTPLQEDLLQLYNDQENSDLVLRSKNKEFPVHKIIVSMRSQVLSDALEDDQVSVLDIPDVDDEILNSFLKFLYTGIVYNLNFETAFKLQTLAEKYQVYSLTNWLDSWFAKMLSSGELTAFFAKSILEN